MCIIIYHEGGKTIPKEYLNNSVFNHPDGFGLTYISKKKKATIFKTLDGDVLVDKYLELVAQFPESPFIVHFRKATHGSVTSSNCHPFRVDNEFVFAHNGTIINCKPEKENKHDKSDTRLFNEQVLRRLPVGWFNNEAIEQMLGDYIKHSKLAILSHTGKVWLINEDYGTWKDEVWYSNTSFCTPLTTNHYCAPYAEGWAGYNNNHACGYGGGYNAGDDHNYAADVDGPNEWEQDGLRMRWNSKSNSPEAFDSCKGAWRVYDTTQSKFKMYPFTNLQHNPKHGQFIKKERGNVIPIKEEEEGKKTQVTMKACGQCECLHDVEELKNYRIGGSVLCNICPKCAKMFRSVDPHIMEQKEVTS